MTARGALRVRWLGRVVYRDALALQHGLHRAGVGAGNWLLLLEHPHVYTMGVRARPEHVLVDPASVGAELVTADRGGDVTYHGPGQLVGYPILDVAGGSGSVPAYVHGVEQLVIDALTDLGLPGCGRVEGFPGVWVDPGSVAPRKIAAVGIRVSRGRSMHGFALNVDPDLAMFGHIVPCGIADRGVTSLAAEGIAAPMASVVDAVVERAEQRWGGLPAERQDVAWRVAAGDLAPFTRGEPAGAAAPGPRLVARLGAAGVDLGASIPIAGSKPEWMRVKAAMGPEFRALRSKLRSLDLVTVCEEAGCPNIFECWADGTATFMIAGERCTRACGFCLVDTRHPLALDPGEPSRVADAVAQMGLAHAVVTMVARDDLADGAIGHMAATVDAIHGRVPGCAVETLISDGKGDSHALVALFAARPEVVAHNVETVPRLQRAVRPSASYARSLAVLARARAAGLTTKTSIILGMGEREDEVLGVLADLAGIGVDIVTLGQYLRPTARHLPVARWWTPAEFDALAAAGMSMGFAHVQASPLTRSSYHARQAASAAASDVASA